MINRGIHQVLALSSSHSKNKRAELSPEVDSGVLERLADFMRPAVPTEVFISYWRFAVERQLIFFRRFHRLPPPWTTDNVLKEHRFTNAYRVSDRVSQYLLRQVQYNQTWSNEDLFFRTILFKFFNRTDTWDRLLAALGEPRVSSFSPERYGHVLDTAMRHGLRIYSAAYIMPSGGPRSGFRRKHDMHLNLLSCMIKDGLPGKIARAKSMAEAFKLLRNYPTIGDFLAYQYITDLNYSTLTDFGEMEFVMAGPGAREGIAKCFRDLGGKDTEWVIRRTAEIQDGAFESLGMEFQSLWGRPLQLIDCQNLFCEVAKYARVRHPEYNGLSGRTRIKQKFMALPTAIPYMLPLKWRLKIPPQNSSKYVACI